MVAEHEAVPIQRAERPIEHDLSERLITRCQVVAIEDRDPRWSAGRADMEVDLK